MLMSNLIYPKMTAAQAKLLWKNMSYEEKAKFNAMYAKLQRGELMLENIHVDDNEEIQNIVLKPKDAPSIPTAPFMPLFPAIKQAVVEPEIAPIAPEKD